MHAHWHPAAHHLPVCLMIFFFIFILQHATAISVPVVCILAWPHPYSSQPLSNHPRRYTLASRFSHRAQTWINAAITVSESTIRSYRLALTSLGVDEVLALLLWLFLANASIGSTGLKDQRSHHVCTTLVHMHWYAQQSSTPALVKHIHQRSWKARKHGGLSDADA